MTVIAGGKGRGEKQACYHHIGMILDRIGIGKTSQDYDTVLVSKTSRTLRRSVVGVNGFSKNSLSRSNTP